MLLIIVLSLCCVALIMALLASVTGYTEEKRERESLSARYDKKYCDFEELRGRNDLLQQRFDKLRTAWADSIRADMEDIAEFDDDGKVSSIIMDVNKKEDKQ